MENQKVTPKVIKVVWKHWRKAYKQSKMMLTGTIIFYSVSMYTDLMFRPTQWKNIFDSLSNGNSPWMAFNLIIIASIVGWVMSRLGETCIVLSESKIIKDLKDYCMEQLLGKSTHFFSTYSSGSLVAKSKRFASASETVIDEFVFLIFRSFFLTIYLVIYSWILIPELTLIFLVWILMFMFVAIILSRHRMKFDLKSSSADSVTTSQISDILLSVFTLRVFSAIPSVLNTFKEVTRDEKIKRRVALFIGNIQWAIQGILVIILEVYCMNLIIGKVENKVYTIGTAVLVQSYIATLSMYMWGLGRSLVRFRTSFADAYEMADLLNEESSEPIHLEDKVIPKSNGIIFSDVTFGYNDGVQALDKFSFNFIAGRRYGLIGKTGSGKSTLTKLILRAYSHKNGTIEVCDESIDSLNKLVLRSWISYVPQDPQFPSWTVREIISMGNPTANDEEIKSAATKASCDFIWKKLPCGFDTIIGERGVKLSGGERQRLAIAAAILKDGPIVIMDEPTSALDAHTEQSIQKAIQMHFEGKTLIVIAHRLSTVAILDEIILLEDGRVKDFGPHDELLIKSSDYREMWELQTQTHSGT